MKYQLLNFLVLLLCTSYTINSFAQCEQLIWSDEFNGNALDETKWSYQRGGWNGSQVQNCYVDDNSTVSNGTLKITSKYEPNYPCFGGAKDFTSGFVQTKDRISWSYGVFKARVKLPYSNSTWPAFWMSPQESVYGAWPRSGEVDIFEIRGHDLSKSYGNAHWGNSGGDKKQDKGTYTFPAGDDASNWHVYEVEWNLGELKFYIDGNHYHTINDFDEPNATTHPGPFNIDFFLRLNVAVGGTYLTPPWNDANNGIDQLPATMEVDWVRVYERNCDDAPTCEIIQNGDFEDGLTDWSLFESGAQGNLQVEPNGFLKIDVITPSNSDWKLALRQANLSLEQGKTYEISFDAYADAARSGSIIMSKIGGAQYAYLTQNFTTILTGYSHQFNMTDPSDEEAIFNLNVGSSALDVYIDNISISELDCVPVCLNPNLLTNPSFENNLEDWEPRKAANTIADFSTINNSEIDGIKVAAIDVTQIGANYWDIQLKRSDLFFEENKTYELTFSIKSDSPDLQFSYGCNQSISNTSIVSGGGLSSTQWQTVRKTFTATNGNSAYLFINLGHTIGNFLIDHVQIRIQCPDDTEPPICDLLVTNVSDFGPASLKEAIECADDGAIISLSNTLQDDTIFIQDNPILIQKNLTIESSAGSPPFLNAKNVERVFEVEAGVILTINNINLVGGQATSSNVMFNSGTAIFNGVEVFNCLIKNNPENPKLGGPGEYTLAADVVIHK